MITLSFMQSVRLCDHEHILKLHRSKITDWVQCQDFAQACAAILKHATIQRPQTNKADSFGFTPAWFMPSVNKHGREGVWRDGEHAGPLTLFVADLDNQHADQPMVTIDDVEAYLMALGLSFLLYTSFSHTAQRHKVRIVIPTDRDLTTDDAYQIFQTFNERFCTQLDGSIYDPGDFLYGPPFASDIRVNLDGSSLTVDDYVSLTFAPRQRHINGPKASYRQMSGSFSDRSVRPMVSVDNPEFVKPEWVGLYEGRYKDGSHSMSMMGVLAKVWRRSGGTLTFGEMEQIYRELDNRSGGYLRSTYGAYEGQRLIKNVMCNVVTPTEQPQAETKKYYPGRAYQLWLAKKRAA